MHLRASGLHYFLQYLSANTPKNLGSRKVASETTGLRYNESHKNNASDVLSQEAL
jgi:hypothetical protein